MGDEQGCQNTEELPSPHLEREKNWSLQIKDRALLFPSVYLAAGDGEQQADLGYCALSKAGWTDLWEKVVQQPDPGEKRA
ncbi:hypothetical protein GCM10008938_31630 [Deinococcus roseus]|uniref:Uncharacterized protein n=1 Tax=Deinococcus roseus TaxID=392414 RepID=A0ABQ2D2C5_9DEIO|nr:hypothetical protein GCM10008938_31630 [Deinococcus roseus]